VFNLLFVSENVSANDDAYSVLVFANCEVENFKIWIFVFVREINGLQNLKVILVKHLECSFDTDCVSFQLWDVNSKSTFIIILINGNFKIMKELACVYCKTRLTSLVGECVENLLANHHHGAVHEVPHARFKSGHQCFLVNKVKVDILICDNLEPDVAFDEVDLASHIVDAVVLLPEACFIVDPEEANGAGGPSNQ
jgi:hypothetical protein